MRALFLVNGVEGSAAGIRARAFAARVPGGWQVRIAYRSLRKWDSVPAFLWAALRLRPDVVYVVDVAYAGVLAGCAAKLLLGCALITDTGDLALELARSSGRYSRLELALIGGVERMALGFSDALVVRGRLHQDLLKRKGLLRVAWISDGVDLEVIRPVDSRGLRRELGLDGSLVVGMVGSMSWSRRHRMCYGWDIVEALGLLKGERVKALLVGDGDGRPRLERRAEELGIRSNLVFVGTVPFSELPRYVCAMDLCVSTQTDDPVGKVRTTGKLPVYLACGRYVAATDVGEAGLVLRGHGALLPYSGVKDECHPRRLANLLRETARDAGGQRGASSNRELAKSLFDYDALAGKVWGFCGRVRLGTGRGRMNPVGWLVDGAESVLDVGCGGGALLEDIRRAYPAARLAGVEMNAAAARHARARLAEADIREGVAEELPFPDRSFQNVTCMEVLEHLPSAHRRRAMREMARVLKPGGRLVVSVPHSGWFAWLDTNNLRFRLPGLYGAVIGRGLRDETYERRSRAVEWHRHFGVDELLGLAGDGLEPVLVRRGGLLLFPLADLFSWPFYRLGVPGHPVRRWLERLGAWEMSLDFGAASYGVSVVFERVS